MGTTPAPTPSPATPEPTTPDTSTPPVTDTNTMPPDTGAGTQGDTLGAQGAFLSPAMIGDAPGAPTLSRLSIAPPPNHPFPPGRIPTVPSLRSKVSLFIPTVQGLKIAEYQSPRPQDRIYFMYNYFNNVNGPVNARLGSPVSNLNVNRYIWGVEKTFFDGNASIGLRLPLDSLNGNSTIRGNFPKPGGTSTSLGDLSVITKFIIAQDYQTGSLISGGMAITVPSGPGTFSGANYLNSLHTTDLQPYLGFIWSYGNFFAQGFSAIDVPMTPSLPTFWYNDLAIGYFLYRNPGPGCLTAVAPVFEAHLTDPMNHRDWTNPNAIGASYDMLNFTYGLNLEFSHRSYLTFAYCAPVTGPRPFAGEAMLYYNFRFGRTRNPGIPPTPPITSG
jgi:hypothetical protein